ncbi:DUF7878 domain-containing protein [Paenibacillus sp. strain BS8-2]
MRPGKVALHKILDRPKQFKNGDVRNFHFISVSFEEAPLIQFLILDEKRLKIQSVWQIFESTITFNVVEIIRISDEFINKLQDDISFMYGINIEDYLEDR